MHIKVTYGDKLVGVFEEDSMFMLPLARKVSDGYIKSFLADLRDGEVVVYQDFDGILIEFQKVKYYEFDNWDARHG